MTVQTTSNQTIAQGNGATTVFPFAFQVPLASYLVVTFTDVNGNSIVLASNQYSVTGIGGLNGGSITYPLSGPPIALGATLLIARVVPYKQLTALKNQAGYYADVVEAALDNLEYQIQQLAGSSTTVNSRALVFPAVDVNPVTVLPVALTRANKVLGFDSLGNPQAVGVPALPPVIANVFNYMTVAQIASVQARNFAVDVSASLAAAFAAGVGVMPPGGYLCSSSVAVSGANGLQIAGSGAAVTEMRFPAGNNGLAITFSDPTTPPRVSGVTITTLSLGAGVFGTGLSVVMSPTAGTAYRQGPRFVDVVVRGADPTLHGWSTCIYMEGLWYPQIDGVTMKGYSAAGAGLNTYQTLYGIHMKSVMGPMFENWIIQHINTGLFEDSTSLPAEGVYLSKFEMVGVRTGMDFGSGVATPVPGIYIGTGHINCSFRGLNLANRVQTVFGEIDFYRTPGTTEAWIGIVAAACDNNIFTRMGFCNTSADATPGEGIAFTGTSKSNIVSHLYSDAWNAAGVCVLLANTTSNNVIDAYTIKPGINGTQWSKVSNIGTGTGNRINDTESAITVLTNNSATPSVESPVNGGFFQTGNNAPTTITNFLGGYPGQVIQVLVNDANTTFGNGANISMRPGQSYTAVAGDVLTFRNYGASLWREVARNASVAQFTQGVFSANVTATVTVGAGGGDGTTTNGYGGKWTVVGYNTVTNKGFIQPGNYGVSFSDLVLCPGGGYIIMGNGALQLKQGADIVAANNLTLGFDGNRFQVTGATQINLINSLNLQAGTAITLHFTGAPTVKHNQAASTTFLPIMLAGSVDFVAANKSQLRLELNSDSKWYEVSRTVA